MLNVNTNLYGFLLPQVGWSGDRATRPSHGTARVYQPRKDKTEKEMVDEYLTTSYNLSQIENLSERYAEYFEELNDMLVQNGSIEAIEAMRDLFMGRITSHTPASGAMYRYVAEKLFLIRDITTRLPNDDFYPIRVAGISKLFSHYNGFWVDVPLQDDFPFTAYISNAEIKRLLNDFTFLDLPLECHAQFKSWLEEANKTYYNRSGDLLLYYY